MKLKSQSILIIAALVFLVAALILGAYLPLAPAGLNSFCISLYILAAIFMGMAVGYSIGFKEATRKQ